MRDFIVIRKNNNFGLTKDAIVLADAMGEARPDASIDIVSLKDRGWLDRFIGRKWAKSAIHIERAFPNWLTAAGQHFLIPNQERFPRRHIGRLKKVGMVLAKTRHAAEIFHALGVPTQYLGFTSQDRRDASVAKDWNGFLHLAGGSTLKGTEDVISLWKRHPDWPVLTLIQSRPDPKEQFPPNIKVRSGYLDDAVLREIQNSHGIHLCPSRSEGWGHHIVEAMSAAALVLTTDAPPMNEHLSAENSVLVAYGRTEPRRLGTNYFVDPAALEEAVERIIAMPAAEKARLGQAARQTYEQIDRTFRANLKQLLAGH